MNFTSRQPQFFLKAHKPSHPPAPDQPWPRRISAAPSPPGDTEKRRAVSDGWAAHAPSRVPESGPRSPLCGLRWENNHALAPQKARSTGHRCNPESNVLWLPRSVSGEGVPPEEQAGKPVSRRKQPTRPLRQNSNLLCRLPGTFKSPPTQKRPYEHLLSFAAPDRSAPRPPECPATIKNPLNDN